MFDYLYMFARIRDKISIFVPLLFNLTCMNIKVFIRNNKKEYQNVCFRLRDTFFDLHYKSEIIISPSDWDEKNQRIKKPSGNIKDELKKRLIDLTDKIDARKKLIRDLFLAQPSLEKLTSDWLVDAIDRTIYPEKYVIELSDNQPETVLTFIADFINKAPQRKDKKTGRNLVYNNIQQYKATEKHLKEFAATEKKSDYQFSEINFEFYSRFVHYLQKPIQSKDENGKLKFNEDGTPVLFKQPFTQNTVGKHIKIFKVMLNEAKTNDADLSRFYVFTEDIDNVYLDEKELKKLKEHDFVAIPYLEHVRDWFLLLAWTGSRFSDLDKIDKANIKNNMITYRQQKTNTSVKIPLHPVVNEILSKYNYQMPEIISNQRFNEYIKIVCKEAKIDNLENFSRTSGGKLITETMPKYQLISSHTCRRSFCTNMYLRGFDTLMIRSISGHRTEKSFLKYIKVSQQQHAEMMGKAWKRMYKK